MKIVRAKVLATGEEKFLVEKENEPGVFFVGFSDEEYKADELEILYGTTTMGRPVSGGMPQMLDTAAMMKEVVDSLKSHFWRDQRVEIAKMLLRRGDVELSQVPEKAEGNARAMKIKADAEAYYNKTIAASLSSMIIQEDMIEKWTARCRRLLAVSA